MGRASRTVSGAEELTIEGSTVVNVWSQLVFSTRSLSGLSCSNVEVSGASVESPVVIGSGVVVVRTAMRRLSPRVGRSVVPETTANETKNIQIERVILEKMCNGQMSNLGDLF